jgi:hypothetical protein
VSANGVSYLSGEIEDLGRIIVFKNGYKEQDKHPDYVVYVSEGPTAKSDAHEETPF